MHYEEFGLNKIEVSGKYLPDKYFQVATAKRPVQSLLVTEGNRKTIYVGTSHGLYRSDDTGKNWTELKQGLFNQDIRVLAQPAEESRTVYAGTGGGIFKSEDGGDHWPEWFDASSGLESGEVNDLAIHPENPDTLYAATQGGLFFTEDGGESWELSFDGEQNPVTLVRLSAVNPQTVYLATKNGVHRSKNGGQNWQRVWSDQISEVLSLVSLNTEPEFIYIGTKSGLFKSFNQGRNWIKDRHKEITAVVCLIANPNDIADLLVAADDKVLASKDGGDNWREISYSAGSENSQGMAHVTRILRVKSPSPLQLVGTTEGLFLSSDGANSWTKIELANGNGQAVLEERKMDLVKLVTEIHTGRFFGSYFMLLVDLATLGLVVLVFTGIAVTVYRKKIKKSKKVQRDEDLETDMLIDIRETADDLSSESMEIHDMIEHISNHLEKCKSIYLSKEKKEIAEIDRHITTLDKKMHNLMQRIGEFDKYSRN